MDEVTKSQKVLKKPQPPMSVAEQIQNLKSLGLTIKDEAYATSFLNSVSYFRFIKAYSLGLKPKNGKYYKGVKFEDIVELYQFNAKLRDALFPQVAKVEITLRCRIGNYFALKYGAFGYKNKENFAIYTEKFESDIKREINRNSRTLFIRNFQQNYEGGEIPIYALFEILSFGMLSKFFKNMHNADKKEVALTFGVSYPYLESWMESIAYVRNICAHYGRLYNTNFTKKPKLYKDDIDRGITNTQIMGTLACLNRLIPHDVAWTTFIDTLEALLEKYPHAKKEALGFPDDWKEVLEDKGIILQ